MKLFNFFKKESAPKRHAIIDIGDQDFEKQVIRRSYKTPVLVDFWASWCGPCRQLGPVLERVAEDPQSAFILAKLNTEQNQKMPAQYGIRSIPAVKLFRNGQVAAEFVGARPEILVRRFLDKAIAAPPPAAQLSIPDDPQQCLEQAEKHLKKGRGFEAFVLLDAFPADADNGRSAALLPLARFLMDVEDGDALTGVEEVDAAFETAVRALQQRKPEKALHALSSARALGAAVDEAFIQAVMSGIFTLLGESHPLTRKYQA